MALDKLFMLYKENLTEQKTAQKIFWTKGILHEKVTGRNLITSERSLLSYRVHLCKKRQERPLS